MHLLFFFPCLRYSSGFSALSNVTYAIIIASYSHTPNRSGFGTEKHNGGKDLETTNGKRPENLLILSDKAPINQFDGTSMGVSGREGLLHIYVRLIRTASSKVRSKRLHQLPSNDILTTC